MKRTVIILLITAMLLCVLCSCNDTQSESSLETSEPVSTETEDSHEESHDAPEPIAIEHETIVSIGKQYQKTKEADDKYPDSYNMELCNGVYADDASYTDTKYAGFVCSGISLRFTFDMGDDYKQLYKFGISYLSSYEAGLGPISMSRIFYSMDGEKWERTGFFTRPNYEDNTQQIAWLVLDQPVDAKYVRFDIKGEKGWLFLDELIIISNTEGSSASMTYLQQLKDNYNTGRLQENAVTVGSEDALRDGLVPICVTEGARYRKSSDAVENFSDDDDLLTDGEDTGKEMESGAYAGFIGKEDLNIDINLNKAVEGICDFELHMYQHQVLQYLLPYYVDFYISDDGKNFTFIGRVFAPSDLNVTNYVFSLHTAKAYTAKWVRFSLPKSESELYLIEEAYAAKYGKKSSESLYGDVVINTEGSTPWSKPSSKIINLVSGLPYQIDSGSFLSYEKEIDHNTLPSAGLLTDGIYSPNTSFDNGYWNKTRNGINRNIYFDLEHVCTITGFKARFLQEKSAGISIPEVTTIYLSTDGKDWYDAKSIYSTEYPSAFYNLEYNFATPILARYIRIMFSVAPHTYCDEIEIFGSRSEESKAIMPDQLGYSKKAGDYMAPDASVLGGVHDLVLIYHNAVETSEDFFLPYVAYLDKDGNILDTMFDGFLFLPSTGNLPSGGYPYDSSEKPNKWSDWKYLYNLTFEEGKGFDALNKTTAKVKEALNLPDDFKVKVYATIMYPSADAKNFGDCDDDGTAEDMTLLADRLKVISTYMDMYLNTFAEKNYDNLELDGFYWFHEAAHYNKDYEMISGAAQIAKERGTQTFWIPYFKASGYNMWDQYEFATACMQPNYVFNSSVPYSQLEDAAKLIKDGGMGIEIEINTKALSNSNYFKRYMSYLGYGITAGYMKDCIHMYYQETEAFNKACYSSGIHTRLVYDSTYQFIKGTLTAPETLAPISISGSKNSLIEGKLFDGEDLLFAELVRSAEHGCISVSPNGTYMYIPNEGFTGTDSFTFRYSNCIASSEETTVTITVK